MVALLFNHASSGSHTAHGILARVNAEERLTADHLTKKFACLGGHGDLLARLVAELAQPSKTQAFDDDLAAIALLRV